MPKLSGHLPKYRKHKSSGQATVTISGRDYYLGPHSSQSSKIAYDRLISEWLVSGRSQSFGAPAASLSLAALLLSFLDHAANFYGTDQASEYHNFVRIARAINKLYSKTAASEFGPLQFKVIREGMIADGASRTHINAQMRRVKSIFRWSAAESLIPVSVVQTLDMVTGLKRGRTAARETKPVLPIDDATVDATLLKLPEVIADMVRLQRLTAARPVEICIIRPCDIDRSQSEWAYTPATHKTEHHGRERHILIGPRGQEILLPYLERDATAYCFSPIESEALRLVALHKKRKTPLSCGNRPGSKAAKRGRVKRKKQPGDCYTTSSYRRAIHRACDLAFRHPELSKLVRTSLSDDQLTELKEWESQHRWSPNRLRHTAATEIRQRFGLEAAQVCLGHSTAAVTQVYAERDMSKAAEVAKQIG